MTDVLSGRAPAPEQPSPPPSPRAPRPLSVRALHLAGKWWFAICTITLIVASDYKTRVRDPKSTLGGGIDPTVLLELALYGLVGLYLVLRKMQPPRLGHIKRVQPHIYLACAFVGLMVLSVVYTAYPQYALVRACQMCVLLGLMLVVVRIGTRADMHRFAHAYIVLIFFSVLYGVAVKSPPVNRLQVGRFTWLAIHPTTSGVLAGIAVIVAVSYLAQGKRPRPGPVWPRFVYIGILAVVLGGVLASQTRGAVAGAVLGSIVVLISLRGGRALVELQVVLVVVIMGIALAFGNTIVSYFERGEQAAQLTSLNSRTNLWETAADAIEARPMFGYGVTSSRGIFYDELGLGGGHNAVVNVFVELGLVGIIVWFGLVISLVYGIAKLPYHQYPKLRGGRALLLGVITFLMVDGIFFDGPGSVCNVASTWFFCCIAWLGVLRNSITQPQAGEGAGPREIDYAPKTAIPAASKDPLSVEEALRIARLRRYLDDKS